MNYKQTALICAAFVNGCTRINNHGSSMYEVVDLAKEYENYLRGKEDEKTDS